MKKGGHISEKYCHFDHGYFEKGIGQGGLGEVVASASTLCKHLVMFSLIYMLGLFPSSLCTFSWACLFLINIV